MSRVENVVFWSAVILTFVGLLIAGPNEVLTPAERFQCLSYKCGLIMMGIFGLVGIGTVLRSKLT